ncbi:DNA-3-methyladenine glycosylase 2 family protein [Nocardia puris]|uniref:DNA-3-methyladenine glycosylase II n=1 Tax=Nocardia puris TaxID=208602 RepID=A0A366DRK9_9NOCA|nr:Ada metal-binding domain-containing protein [Nocardia puris]MBF6210794.1 DNA-3-methyladenine glycosylase 2 family protein [Nocardia puris]MBF6364389.1 DNA-3-methyladenine glycosylase 2 family protein [Nocardia puris]MBF6459318.1 DNA-3-methyladenine glycosylase 2 family protein [Nocardia puris]RBO92722.1 DNA-3-methyladenine glycosylase II [Nocardia puris]
MEDVTITGLDFERCYRAVSTRDSRFDGQFFTAVRTTGIYCRPSCPAITPKRANVTFLPTAAAAQHAGFRACRRCLPDAAPGSPLWNTRADLAARAMRLIGDGVIERGGVPALAATLGYSQRQLTRVLTTELGAGPLALARAHRAHTARLLIQTTDMPMSDIAFAAGFASIRQFNDTVREVFAVSPTTMRTEAQRAQRNPARSAPVANGVLSLRLPYREPLDKAWLEWFLSAHVVPGMELWEDRVYTRNLRTPHGHAAARLSFQRDHVRAELALHDMRDLAPTVARVRHLLDLDADPVGIDEALGVSGPDSGGAAPDDAGGRSNGRSRPQLTPGIRVPGCLDGPELLLRTMIGQQISVSAAATHTARLVEALGEPVEGPVPRLFPTPAVIAERGAEVLTGPARRIRSIVGAAAALASGDLVLHAGRTAADLRRDLLALDGVGPWTADYVTMRLLADPDVLLATDLVVRQGADLLGVDLTDTGRWAPWRSYLSMHLWRAALRQRAARPSDSLAAQPKASIS